VALKHAVLASLLDGEASGYDLSKRMDISVANFWHVVPAQLYAELRRLEDENLIEGRDVAQERRPNKRVFSLTDAGRDELRSFIREEPRPPSAKDELLVQVQAADIGDLEALAATIDQRRKTSEVRLAVFEALAKQFLRGRTEEEFLTRARRIGPYVTLRRGLAFERENIAWYRWAAAVLRKRAGIRPPSENAAATISVITESN